MSVSLMVAIVIIAFHMNRRLIVPMAASIALATAFTHPAIAEPPPEDKCLGQVCWTITTENELIAYHFEFDTSRWEYAAGVNGGPDTIVSGDWREKRNRPFAEQNSLWAEVRTGKAEKSYQRFSRSIDDDRAAAALLRKRLPSIRSYVGGFRDDRYAFVGKFQPFTFGSFEGSGNRFRAETNRGRTVQIVLIEAHDGLLVIQLLITSWSATEAERTAEIQDLVRSFGITRVRLEKPPPRSEHRLTVEELICSLKREC